MKVIPNVESRTNAANALFVGQREREIRLKFGAAGRHGCDEKDRVSKKRGRQIVRHQELGGWRSPKVMEMYTKVMQIPAKNYLPP